MTQDEPMGIDHYKMLKKRYSEIKEVLTILTLKGDQTARASRLLGKISFFKFILMLNIMKTILKSINCLSNELQSASIIFSKSMDLVNIRELM